MLYARSEIKPAPDSLHLNALRIFSQLILYSFLVHAIGDRYDMILFPLHHISQYTVTDLTHGL